VRALAPTLVSKFLSAIFLAILLGRRPLATSSNASRRTWAPAARYDIATPSSSEARNVVTGIATTAFVTLDVVKRAAAARLNMIIPHEATFWSDRDDTAVVSRDPLYAAKVELMKKHDIVVFRIHDHMHAQRPDFTFVGSARAVGLDSRFTRPRPARIASSSRRRRSGRWRLTSSGEPARARCAWSATRPRR
jgi:hypothetical protein